MFIREKHTPNSNKTAIQLVENIRQGNKVVQKVIRHFGYALNPKEIEELKKIALRYKYELEHQGQLDLFTDDKEQDIVERVIKALDKEEEKDLPVNLRDLREEQRLSVGVQYSYKQIYDSIGFNVLNSKNTRRNELAKRLFHVVLARIIKPMSKRKSVGFIEEEYGVEIDLNGIYRLMDKLTDQKIERIKQLSYNYVNDLLSEELNVIFYDCTTLYFESTHSDEVRSNGYSKDGKFNEVQVLLSILVTDRGLPIGYELYEGNKYEGHTLRDAIERLHSKYKINKIIFVADSGLLSKDNIDLLQFHNEQFIVGARIKNLPEELTRQILDKSLYNPLNEQEEDPITYQEITLEKGLRLIVTYSEHRAQKDKYDRQKAIESLQKRLSKSKNLKSLLNNYGYKKFLKVEGEGNLKLNEEKIIEWQAWDGLHGILTNIPTRQATVEQILHHYKGLWQVEETFRISKHTLRMRPIFHWEPRRIKAHIAICYMALVCTRVMEHKVRLQYKKMSPSSIHHELLKMQISVLKDLKTGHRYALPSKASQEGKKILQIFGKKWTETPWMIT